MGLAPLDMGCNDGHDETYQLLQYANEIQVIYKEKRVRADKGRIKAGILR